jgi:hypothetical protein
MRIVAKYEIVVDERGMITVSSSSRPDSEMLERIMTVIETLLDQALAAEGYEDTPTIQ